LLGSTTEDVARGGSVGMLVAPSGEREGIVIAEVDLAFQASSDASEPPPIIRRL